MLRLVIGNVNVLINTQMRAQKHWFRSELRFSKAEIYRYSKNERILFANLIEFLSEWKIYFFIASQIVFICFARNLW